MSKFRTINNNVWEILSFVENIIWRNTLHMDTHTHIYVCIFLKIIWNFVWYFDDTGNMYVVRISPEIGGGIIFLCIYLLLFILFLCILKINFRSGWEKKELCVNFLEVGLAFLLCRWIHSLKRQMLDWKKRCIIIMLKWDQLFLFKY